MKALHNRICTLLLLSTIATTVYSATIYDNACSLFKDGMFIKMPETCTDYIYCQNNTAQMYTCIEPSSFDRALQKCVQNDEKLNDDCKSTPCKGIKNGNFVSDPASCNGYYYCENDVGYFAQCPYGMDFNGKICDYPSSQCVFVSSICQLVPDKTKFRNDNDCSKYFQCDKNALQSKNCAKDTYFDKELDTCVNKKNVECTAHPLPECKTGVNYKAFKEDKATCHGYFHCKDLGLVADIAPLWFTCPEGLFFSEAEQNCLPPTEVPCVYNRCYGRGNMLVQSGGNYCHDYIKCENNKEIATYECDNYYFFNEHLQSCVKAPTDFKCCDLP